MPPRQSTIGTFINQITAGDFSRGREEINNGMRLISQQFSELARTQRSTVQAGLTLVIAAPAVADRSEVLIQVVDAAGLPLPGIWNLDVWLSDSPDGAGLTATTASGTVDAKSTFGTLIGTYTAKKALRVQTIADGSVTIDINDTAHTPFWVAAQSPQNGETAVSLQMTDASYG